MPHKCKRNLLGLLVWINKVDPFFFVHLFSTTVATVPAAAAAAAVAAFFSHRAIIDVYFHWNKEGIVDGISDKSEREGGSVAHFLLTIACALAISSTFAIYFCSFCHIRKARGF